MRRLVSLKRRKERGVALCAIADSVWLRGSPVELPELHACNYTDAAGKVCGRLGHRRCNHKDHALPKQ